jgi:hypothetical protein
MNHSTTTIKRLFSPETGEFGGAGTAPAPTLTTIIHGQETLRDVTQSHTFWDQPPTSNPPKTASTLLLLLPTTNDTTTGNNNNNNNNKTRTNYRQGY